VWHKNIAFLLPKKRKNAGLQVSPAQISQKEQKEAQREGILERDAT
jgi:hypothetical protein